MPAVVARLVSGDRAEELSGSDLLVFPAGPCLIAVDAPLSLAVRLDGRVAPFVRAGGERLLAVDLTRSTGFHHLQIGFGSSYWFGTEDAKLGLDGVQRMLEWLREECQSWTGQLVFSTGERWLDPYVAYGWLDQHADASLAAARSITSAPKRRSHTARRVTDRAGGRIDVEASIALMRRRALELLVPGTPGVRVGAREYQPRKVAVRTRVPTLDTPANRRVAWLLVRLIQLAEYVSSAPPLAPERERVAGWHSEAITLLGHSFLAHLSKATTLYPPAGEPTTEELTDKRYGTIWRRSQTARAIGDWQPSLEPRPVHAYVKASDEIYQAFVLSALGEALDLKRVGDISGGRQPAYRGATLDLYSDSLPPRTVLRSWRSFTSAPDSYRPDMLLHDRSRGSVLVGDAKYRQSADGAAESGRKDLHAYMDVFGVHAAALFYAPQPGAPMAVHTITAQGRAIVEVTVAPRPDLLSFLRTRAVPALVATMAVPPWRG
jgi:hypothetical protein